jgi:flagellar hook-associated protein 2
MAGSLSNIGLGSNGALNYDIIDQLREVDENTQIKPIDNKISENTTKQKDLSILYTLTASLKGSASSLSDESLYLRRKSTLSSDAIEVKVSSSTQIQDFDINITNLAKRDILDSKTFENTNSTFTNELSDTININIDGKDYTIDVTSSTTINDLKEKINSSTDGKVEASILNVGGSNPYKLIIKSTETGIDQKITISSNGTAANDLSLNNIQAASDANFKFNGVDITRSSNTFSDLIAGVEITLKKENESSQVSISQDTSDIISNLEDFVSKYNELINNLNEATKYDPETKNSGTFQGVSQITSIKSSVNRILLSVDSKGQTLEEFGINLNESGTLEFNQSTFDEKISSDPDGVKEFFAGSTTYDTTIRNGSTINSGSLDLSGSDFSINGINVEISLNGTATENALALKNAINNAGIVGVVAELNSSNDSIILKSVSGEDIKISGDSSKLSFIGLSEGSTLGNSTTTTGVFTSFNTTLRDLVIGDDSVLKIYENSLSEQAKALNEERQKTVDSLNSKYQVMAEKFMAYDSIISKLNSSFQSLSMMIEQSYNNNN